MSASAEARSARRAEWFDDARMGFFVHWGRASHPGEGAFETNPDLAYPYPDLESFEAAVGPDLSPAAWVRDAVAIGASYITLAAFHVGLGNLRPWRSRIPGSPTTSRDLLGELCDAAETAGIRVMVYVGGGPNPRHPHFTEWLDAEAYRAHTGTDVDLTTHEGFVEFTKDVLGELLDAYPRVAALWWDGWHDDEEAQEIFAHLHESHPRVLIFRNNFSSQPLPDEDVQSIEDFGKVFSPEWDFASGASVDSFDREFALKATMDWFYVHESHPHYAEFRPAHEHQPDPQVVVKRLVTILGSGWSPHPGFSPDVRGVFPPPVRRVIDHLAAFWSWAGPSFVGAEAGGHGRGGLPPGHWSDGAYGVTTVSTDQRRHWLHLLAAPSSGEVTLPDAGYTFTAAHLLHSGAPVPLKQSEGLLRLRLDDLDGLQAHGDLVVELAADGPAETREAAVRSVTVDGTPADRLSLGHLGAELAQSATDAPHETTIELRSPTLLSGLAIRQADDCSVTGEGYEAKPSTRLRDYRLHATVNGERVLLEAGTLFNARGMQVIQFPPLEVEALHLTSGPNWSGGPELRLRALTPVAPGGGR